MHCGTSHLVCAAKLQAVAKREIRSAPLARLRVSRAPSALKAKNDKLRMLGELTLAASSVGSMIFANLYARAEDLSSEMAVEATNAPAQAADLTSAVEAAAASDSALSVALTYGGLFGLYFVALPPLILQYCRSRWYTRSSFETVFMFMLVFLDFPGLLIWAPFVNFRPDGRDNRVL